MNDPILLQRGEPQVLGGRTVELVKVKFDHVFVASDGSQSTATGAAVEVDGERRWLRATAPFDVGTARFRVQGIERGRGRQATVVLEPLPVVREPVVQHIAPIDLDARLERGLGELDQALERVAHTHEWWINVLDSAHSVLGCAVALDDREAAKRALVVLQDAARAILAVTFQQMRHMPLTLEGKPLVFEADPYPLASPDTWTRGFYAGMIARNDLVTGHMASVPGSQLLNPRIRAQPYAYMLCNCLRGLRIDADGWQKVLADAQKRVAENDELPRYDRLIGVPMLALLDTVYAGVPAFDAALHEALVAHKAWWTSEDRAEDPRGLVALGPLAMAAWAHSCGFATTVESDYLPYWMLTARW
jgi:hypothetical protein